MVNESLVDDMKSYAAKAGWEPTESFAEYFCHIHNESKRIADFMEAEEFAEHSKESKARYAMAKFANTFLEKTLLFLAEQELAEDEINDAS